MVIIPAHTLTHCSRRIAPSYPALWLANTVCIYFYGCVLPYGDLLQLSRSGAYKKVWDEQLCTISYTTTFGHPNLVCTSSNVIWVSNVSIMFSWFSLWSHSHFHSPHSELRGTELQGIRCMVTGGCGFLGSHLVKMILDAGAGKRHNKNNGYIKTNIHTSSLAHVVVLDARKSPLFSSIVPQDESKMKLVLCDIRDKVTLHCHTYILFRKHIS